MRSKYRSTALYTSLSMTLGLLAASPLTLAQPGQADSSASGVAARTFLEEVVVTARRKKESAQDISVALTAFGADQLAEQSLSNMTDLAGHIPSFSVSNYGQNRMVESVAIRGQGSGYLAAPAVVQYIAEVPLISGKYVSVQGGPGMFLDLDAVQVLRGPQGTLFGRNSTGGAVLLEPTRPGQEFAGYLQAQRGNYDNSAIEAAVDLPLNDTLQLRIAGMYEDRDGFTKDVNNGVDYDDKRNYMGRIGINWQPSDSVENYLLGFYAKGKSKGTGYILRGFNEPYVDDLLKSYGMPGGCSDLGLGEGCSVLTQLSEEQDQRGIRRVALGPAEQLDTQVENWMLVNKLSVDLSEDMTLRNIMSYGKLVTDGSYDGDGTVLNWYDSYFDQLGDQDDISQLTAELQLQGQLVNNSLEYTGGIYYEKLKTPRKHLLSAAPTFALSAFASGYTFESEATALYAQIDFDIGQHIAALQGLSFNGGLRYTWDTMSGEGSAVEYSDFDYQEILACADFMTYYPESAEVCAFAGKHDSESESWTMGLDYHVSDELLTFAKVSKGYKTGGVNFTSVNPANRSYEPEYLTTYELGFKSTFYLGDTQVLLNAAAFVSHYKDIQVTADDFDPVSLSSGAAVYNAAEAKIKGFEAEAQIRLLAGLELSATYSLLRGDYDDFDAPTQGQIDCSGNFVTGTAKLSCQKFPYLPKSQYSLAARYSLPVAPEYGELVGSAVYAFTGEQFGGTTELPEYEPGSKLESYGLLNLSLNWYQLMGSAFDASAFVTNALDKEYVLTLAGVYQSLGVHTVTYGEPRMFGVKLRYNW